MFATDPQGIITAWSVGAERMFGWSAEQMCGQPFDQRLGTAERNAEVLRAQMQRALRDGKAHHEGWYLRADGSRLRGAGTLTPVFCEGELSGFLKILNDCTAQDAVAQRLADSDQRYRTLFDAIDAGFCVIEMKFDEHGRPVDYRFLETNPAFERQTGLADAVGRWMTDLAPTHEQHWFDIYGEVALSRRPVRFENNAEALQRWFEVQAMPVGDPAEHRVAILFNDVSGRRSAERALQALTDSLREEVATRTKDRNQLWELSSDVMLRCRFDGIIIAVNPAWQQLLGWSEAQLLGADTKDLIHPDDIPGTLEAMHRSSQGESILHFENRYRCSDGSYRWISWSSRPADAVINAVGRDVTALKQQALALEQAEAQLRQSQKMEAVGQLTGGLAHDFNNLLTGIGGSLELLAKRIEQGRFDALEHYVTVAQTATRRAAALTHRLLAFSRRQTLDPMATDVGELVSDLRELLSRTVGPSIGLQTQLGSDRWLTLVDRNQLENALLNLAINARDAMPDGGTLTIEVRNEALDGRSALALDVPSGPYIRIDVTDSGVGMSEDVVAQAFDPFFTTKPLGMGTGLGLSMVYGFTRQSGGQVKILSEPDRGTRISLYLPHVALDDCAPRTGSERDIPAPASGGAGETVLVVDDEPAVRMLVSEILQELGYQVLQAADGKAGLGILQSRPQIALLITDVGLPGGMNGRQLADAARQRDPRLKVLFITGYAENAVMGSGQLEPGMRIVTKPFSIDVLAARIAELRGER
ncbi:PAS domain-containing hybrid sensor histidine kinase/response regulator [Stutzerimonas stutzeri]|uniref:histidine kinase n=1 Tax=Stutzerimonas stutzeri TaxID=316 RepID=A0A6I6LSD3_STUST|nr:PAS domain S-box protein [Stutzerimonas stutzeri]QGZ32110.1 PAS domain S-box protein [Stutzerimonas stutzeri]